MVPRGTSYEGSAATIVARCEHDVNPDGDGREAWLELERMYGGRAHDERPAKLRALERRLRDLQCNFYDEEGHHLGKI